MTARRAATLLLTLLLATAPAKAEIESYASLPFREGENLLFKVSWLFFDAGMVEAGVPETTAENGERLMRFRLRAWTTNTISHIFTMDDIFESVWDPNRRLPRSMTVRIRESSTTKDKFVELRHGDGEASVTQNGDPPKTFKMDPDAQDFFSASYFIRTLDLAIGKKLHVPVFEDNKNYKAEIQVVKRERLRVMEGKVDTIMLIARVRFEGALQGSKLLYVWVTDDQNHLPVKMRAELLFGDVVLDLVKAGGAELKFAEEPKK